MPAAAQVLKHSTAVRARPDLLGFVCSHANGGPGAARVHVAGELDIATTPQLEQALSECGARARLVVLDLRELAFLDSSGVHAIVNASIHARQAGRRLIVLRAPPHSDRIFQLTGSSDDVEIHDFDPTGSPVEMLPAAQRELAGRPFSGPH